MKNNSKRIVSVTLIVIMVLSLSAVNGAAAPSNEFLKNFGPRGSTVNDPANGIYVSPNGSDSTATGSVNSPYKTINAALAAVRPGGTVILRGGTYREGINVRVRIPNVTIKSAKGEWAVIDLTKYDRGADEDSGVYFDVGSSGGKLQGVEVKGGFYAVCMETKWQWGDPADRTGASNIIIEDCVLHDSRYDVVKVKPNCNNVTIRYNEIYNSGQAFAGRPKNGEDNAEGIDNVNGDAMKVQNNYIHDICSNAIYAKGGATDALIENNRIERAYGGGVLVGFDTSPEFFDTKTNPKYYENIRAVVRNNLIVGTGWEGIGLYGSKDAQICNNTLVNVANGGQYHSAIYFGLTYQDWESYAGRPSTVNPNIHHNIVSQPSGVVRPMIEIRYANELGGMSALEGNPTMNNNCYYIAGKSAVFADYRPKSMLENAKLSAWQSHINGDKDSIEADPALDADYMPANRQCAGMGVSFAQTAPSQPATPAAPAAPALSSMQNFKKNKTYRSGQFPDVNENEWYGYNKGKTIAAAYEYGLMGGDDKGAFNPEADITLAEAVTVAAKVHNIYNGSPVTFPSGGVPWYKVYVDYAETNMGLKFPSSAKYDSPATRGQMADIFSRALPGTEFKRQNTVNAIPDVTGGTSYREAIIMLYEAGVIKGDDEKGTFNPKANITRAQAATIISRVILPSTRESGRTFG